MLHSKKSFEPEAVKALEKAARLPHYQREVLARAPATAAVASRAEGVFMGYDFHLGAEGPALIEINSNAGGALLCAALIQAQQVCCGVLPEAAWKEQFETKVAGMFEQEWRLQGSSGRPATVAIVDDRPQEQYLYPEFLLVRALLQRHGMEAFILAPEQLRYEDARLMGAGRPLDLVYNRLVDFGLLDPTHEALRRAWVEGTAVITPNPRVHALLADKRNLALLSDPERLRGWGLEAEDAALLGKVVPRTRPVRLEDAETLWQERRHLFFKPAAAHGSKGVYRGDKLTKRVFEEILCGGYVAQEYVPPSERSIRVDGEVQQLKMDVRLYTYQGQLLIPAARLYQGQATNFRTPGGGFAPVLLVDS